MVIAKAETPDREILILGLTEENLARIQQGKPLVVSSRTNAPPGALPHPGYEIVIMTGKDENAIRQLFEQHGMIGPETEVHIDPRL